MPKQKPFKWSDFVTQEGKKLSDLPVKSRREYKRTVFLDMRQRAAERENLRLALEKSLRRPQE